MQHLYVICMDSFDSELLFNELHRFEYFESTLYITLSRKLSNFWAVDLRYTRPFNDVIKNSDSDIMETNSMPYILDIT